MLYPTVPEVARKVGSVRTLNAAEECMVRTLRPHIVLTCLIACMVCALAHANVIQLRDGSKLKGELLKRPTTELHLKVDGLDLFVPKKDVAAIDGKDLATDYTGMLQERLDALAPGDADARYQLALWCGEHGLKEDMKKLLAEVTELAPWHELANAKLGKIKHNGLWWTHQELLDKGLVEYQGQWMTQKERDELKGKVRYLSQWVSKKDKELLEERKYSQWKSSSTSHKLYDIQCDIRVLRFINRLDVPKRQMRELMKVLAKPEAERMGFLDKRHEINAECEVAWLRLKEAAMFGVIDSFNVERSIEGAAGMAEKAWKGLRTAYVHRMMLHTEEFVKALTTKQRQEVMYGLCGDCHCATKTSAWVEPPEQIKRSDKYCARRGCHPGGKGMGSDDDRRESQPEADPQALELVEQLRTARPDRLDGLAKKVLELYPERTRKVEKQMSQRMKAQSMKALREMTTLSPKDMTKRGTISKFRKACGSGGCHPQLARMNGRKAIRRYVGSMKNNTGMSVKARMDNMFASHMGMMMDQPKRRKKKGKADPELAKVHELIAKIRRLLNNDYREQKQALAGMVMGESELASLGRLAGSDTNRMKLIMRPKKTRGMYTKYVMSDGRLFQLMAEKLKMSDREVDALIGEALKPEKYDLSDDIMFDVEARVKAGQDLYKLRCCVCHTIEKPGSAIKTRDDWWKTLKCMKHISYNLTEKECEVICDFLAQRNEQEDDEAL